MVGFVPGGKSDGELGSEGGGNRGEGSRTASGGDDSARRRERRRAARVTDGRRAAAHLYPTALTPAEAVAAEEPLRRGRALRGERRRRAEAEAAAVRGVNVGGGGAGVVAEVAPPGDWRMG